MEGYPGIHLNPLQVNPNDREQQEYDAVMQRVIRESELEAQRAKEKEQEKEKLQKNDAELARKELNNWILGIFPQMLEEENIQKMVKTLDKCEYDEQRLNTFLYVFDS